MSSSRLLDTGLLPCFPVEMQDVVVFVFAWVKRVDVHFRTLGYFWRGNVLL